jgi:hypothetical protein
MRFVYALDGSESRNVGPAPRPTASASMPLPIFVALVLLMPGGVTLVVRRRNAAA